MQKLLYLDTARLGRMSPTASKMYTEFGRLAAEFPTGPCTDRFLFRGANVAPEIAEDFPELYRWRGVDGLEQQLRTAFAVNTGPSTKVLLASRTTDLMEQGVRSILGHCSRVLLTDLTWPPYLRWLLEYLGRNGIDVSVLTLKDAVWNEHHSADAVTDQIISRVRKDHCDGLFLPAVTHSGIRLPVADILMEVRAGHSDCHTIVDASQAFGHIDTNEWTHLAEFTFGGMHKWVRAYLPLSIGFLTGRARRTSHMEPGPPRRCEGNETINFSPFMTTCGALSDLSDEGYGKTVLPWDSFRPRQLINQEWTPLHSDASLRCQIRLVRPRRRMSQTLTRKKLAAAGIAATVFPDSTVRLSFPVNWSV